MNFVAQDFKTKREDLFQVSVQAQLIAKQVVVLKFLVVNSNNIDCFITKILLCAAGAIKKRFVENATLWPSWNADSFYMLNDRLHLSNQS